MNKYSGGVPSFAIWGLHILVGLYFLWLGYNMISSKFKPHGVILVVFGALMFSYHGHLWFNSLVID
tara:strand:+ start:325 stop:522 length:198 start_codon:yes stop_codon:yes gene_type:complete